MFLFTLDREMLFSIFECVDFEIQWALSLTQLRKLSKIDLDVRGAVTLSELRRVHLYMNAWYHTETVYGEKRRQSPLKHQLLVKECVNALQGMAFLDSVGWSQVKRTRGNWSARSRRQRVSGRKRSYSATNAVVAWAIHRSPWFGGGLILRAGAGFRMYMGFESLDIYTIDYSERKSESEEKKEW